VAHQYDTAEQRHSDSLFVTKQILDRKLFVAFLFLVLFMMISLWKQNEIRN
jgi:hypothetical protein